MCDYSLECYQSRPAVNDEQYTLHRFRSGTLGFIAGTACDTAVCMPTGARLQLEGIDEKVQRAFAVGPAETVVMTRLRARDRMHHDAVRFANGREVLLQSLNTGVSARLAPRHLTELLGLDAKAESDFAFLSDGLPSHPTPAASYAVDGEDGAPRTVRGRSQSSLLSRILEFARR